MREIFDDFKNTFWKDARLFEYEQVAREHDFQLHQRERFAEQDYQLKNFRLFKGKRGKRLRGILFRDDKKNSTKDRIYDYLYYGDSKTKISTVFEFYAPSLNLSHFLIRPRSNFNLFKQFFVNERLIYPHLTRFNKYYHIRIANRNTIKYELNEGFLDLLSEQTKLWVEGHGNYVLFYYKNKAIPIEKLMWEYEYVKDLLNQLLYGHSSEEYV